MRLPKDTVERAGEYLKMLCADSLQEIRRVSGLAAEWLDPTSEPIASIAVRIGYENPFHFTRAFRRTHGLSPSAFRTRVRG